MKKLVILVGIVLSLAGCEAGRYSVLVKNESTVKTVSYTYNGISDTLAPSESKTYEVEAYTPPPTNISVPGALSVIMNRQGDTFTFKDVDGIPLKVTNALSINVTIKAGNYIWDETNNSVELNIPKNTERVDNLVIYTANPRFTSTSSYPVVIDWNFDGNTVYVVIK